MMLTGIVRIGNEPVMRATNSGDPVLELNLAYNYGRRDDSGKKPTQWIYASLYGNRGEKLVPYLKKGDQIFVCLNDVHVSIYQKKDGSGEAYAVRAKVQEIELIGNRAAEMMPASQRPERQRPAPKPDAGFDAPDDDIPF
jgi:single-strand DNA-binding protein